MAVDPPVVKCTRFRSPGARAASFAESRAAGSFVMSTKLFEKASVITCSAIASAISRRPRPILVHQSPPTASKYFAPFASHSHAPSPRLITSAPWSSKGPKFVHGCRACARSISQRVCGAKFWTVKDHSISCTSSY